MKQQQKADHQQISSHLTPAFWSSSRMSTIVFRKRKSHHSTTTIRNGDVKGNSKSDHRSRYSDGYGDGDGDDNNNNNDDNLSPNNNIHSKKVNCCCLLSSTTTTSSTSSSTKKPLIIILFYVFVLIGIFAVSFFLVPASELLPLAGSTKSKSVSVPGASSSLSKEGIVVFHSLSQHIIGDDHDDDDHSLPTTATTTTTTTTTATATLQNLYEEDILKNVYSPIFKSGIDIHEIHEQRTFTYYHPPPHHQTETKTETKTFVMDISYPKYDLQDIFHDYDENISSTSSKRNSIRSSSSSSSSSTSNDHYYKTLRELYNQSKKRREGSTTFTSTSSSTTKQRQIPNHISNTNSNSNSNSNIHGVILTRRGYKGGPIHYQTNQDRAIIIKPFPFYEQLMHFNDSSNGTSTSSNNGNDNDNDNDCCNLSMFIGIFDGHSEKGHLVSNFVQQYLPKVLSINLASVAIQMREEGLGQGRAKDGIHTMDNETEKNKEKTEHKIMQAIIQSFHTVDEAIPHKIAIEAGCTTSSILQVDHNTIYTANVGDSTSFIMAYNRSARNVHIVYETKKHKPHMKVERERIERMGGRVEIPSVKEQVINGVRMEVSSRVVIPKSGVGDVSLAMSRSLGDRDGRKVGVISEPTIEVLNIQSLLTKAKEQSEISSSNEEIELFAIAASDGLLDFLEPSAVAKRLEPKLYSMNTVGSEDTLQQACEELILEASSNWVSLGFHYRDDITIAISRINRI